MEAGSACLSFCLYHGTKFIHGKKILSEKVFTPSIGRRHWLGDGIYFFEEESEAKDWCLRYGSYMILEADVAVRKDRFLDLKNKKHFRNYRKVMGRLLNEAKERGINISKTDKIDSHVIDFINNNLTPVDVTRAVFFVENKIAKKYRKTYGISPTRIYDEQVQYCVRRSCCVKDIRKRMSVL